MYLSFGQCPVIVVPLSIGLVTLIEGLIVAYVGLFQSMCGARYNGHSSGVESAFSFLVLGQVLYSVSSDVRLASACIS